MKSLTNTEANSYLAPLGLKIGKWCEISSCSEASVDHWTNYKAPEASRDLLNFCYRIASWLPRGDWKLLQIDNSTYLDASQKLILGTLLFGNTVEAFETPGSYLINFTEDKWKNDSDEILLAYVIYFFLLFEGHCYLVAAAGERQQRLGIQDGFVYFVGADSSLAAAAGIVKEFEDNPGSLPDWIVRINSSRESDDPAPM